MVLGDTTQKLQKVANMAEDLYKKINELRQQIVELREQLDATSDDVSSVKRDVEEQRAILTALAEQQGIDVDQVIAEATIEEAEAQADDAEGAGESAAGTGGSAEGTGAGGASGDATDGGDQSSSKTQ